MCRCGTGVEQQWRRRAKDVAQCRTMAQKGAEGRKGRERNPVHAVFLPLKVRVCGDQPATCAPAEVGPAPSDIRFFIFFDANAALPLGQIIGVAARARAGRSYHRKRHNQM